MHNNPDSKAQFGYRDGLLIVSNVLKVRVIAIVVKKFSCTHSKSFTIIGYCIGKSFWLCIEHCFKMSDIFLSAP